jgi:hypothetical protein
MIDRYARQSGLSIENGCETAQQIGLGLLDRRVSLLEDSEKILKNSVRQSPYDAILDDISINLSKAEFEGTPIPLQFLEHNPKATIYLLFV